jgi:UDP-N-acetylglucosamine--N-acetylmuramyl-(pentapeptide) pyrophosphoryl-undecaprenol N-acetylglucosamine transferase
MSTIVLSAGGTGGHLFPAQALAAELARRGYAIVVMTDARFKNYETAFPTAQITTVPSAAFSDRSVLRLALAPFEILAGLSLSLLKLARLKPRVVVGFGGYPSVPVMLAACLKRIPTVILTPDALLGRANRLLANHVGRIAANLPLVRFLPKDMGKVVYTGNPLRAEVMAYAFAPFPELAAEGRIELLVFGGSQGAHVFSDIVPAALARLSRDLRQRLRLTQQCRPEDLDAVRHTYAQMGIDAELAPFFSDLPQRMAAAHLVIGRAGAGTVSELALIGRPAVLVPLPHALDDNQMPNAEAFATAGAGWAVRQSEFSAERLASLLTEAFAAPEALAHKAHCARKLAYPHATLRLADLVEELGRPS